MRNKTASVMRRTLAAVVLIAVLAAAALSAGAQDNEQLIDGIICREAAKNNGTDLGMVRACAEAVPPGA